MSVHEYPDCAACPHDWSVRLCRTGAGKAPANCPTARMRELADEALAETVSPENYEMARLSSVQEARGYAGRDQGYARVRPAKPRIVEILEFAARMGYRRLGLAFCIGLRKEAAVVRDIMEANSFTAVTVACKAGAAPKSSIGVGGDCQVDPGAGHESMCNPVFQAKALNASGTELNVLLGLCVGHDSLFLKHSQAPCTVLAVKDRVLGHNPLAAIWQIDGYYRYLKSPLDPEGA